MTPNPSHYTLGELIARLREEPDPSRRLKVGFRNPHSYRGFYTDVAFEIAADVTVGAMLAAAESALGATFQGWKGGDYTMADYTDTWLVEREGTTGETLGAVLLDLMLGDAAYRAGREDWARGIVGYLYRGPNGEEMLFHPADVAIVRAEPINLGRSERGEEHNTERGSE